VEFINQKYKLNFKRIFIKCAAFLLIIYVLAGISIFQDYFGNETIGIPPAHHFSKRNSDTHEVAKNIFRRSENPNDSQNQYDHEHLSFCSAGILFESFVFEFSPIIYSDINSQPSISYENKHSYSASNSLFRPPRIA
jgi:hypothetical protein